MTQVVEIALHGRYSHKSFVVDADEPKLDLIRTIKWYGQVAGISKIYVQARGGLILARVLMDAPLGFEVDHMNGDPLDNRRANLRIVTHHENQQNKHVVWARSGYRGVHACGRKWKGCVVLHGVHHYTEMFDDPETCNEAVIALRRELLPFSTV